MSLLLLGGLILAESVSLPAAFAARIGDFVELGGRLGQVIEVVGTTVKVDFGDGHVEQGNAEAFGLAAFDATDESGAVQTAASQSGAARSNANSNGDLVAEGASKIKSSDDPLRDPINKRRLVFAGGGAKGVVHGGSIAAMHANTYSDGRKYIDQFKMVGGSSAGAMAAFVVALPFTREESDRLFFEMSLNQFLDRTATSAILNGMGTTVKVGTQAVILPAALKGLYEKFSGRGKSFLVGPGDLQGLYSNLAISKGQEFLRFFEEKLRAKVTHDLEVVFPHQGLDPAQITFEHLHQLRLRFPARYKDLFVTGTAVVGDGVIPGTLFYFNYQNESTKHVPIARAVRASGGFPFAFPPIDIQVDIDGVPTTILFTDGGAQSNIPMEMFDFSKDEDRKLHLVTAPRSSMTHLNKSRRVSPKTLGFAICDVEECQRLMPGAERAAGAGAGEMVVPQGSFGEVFKAILSQQTFKILNYYNKNTLPSYAAGVPTLELDPAPLQKLAMYWSGYLITERFLHGALPAKWEVEPIVKDILLIHDFLKFQKRGSGAGYSELMAMVRVLERAYTPEQVRSIKEAIVQTVRSEFTHTQGNFTLSADANLTALIEALMGSNPDAQPGIGNFAAKTVKTSTLTLAASTATFVGVVSGPLAPVLAPSAGILTALGKATYDYVFAGSTVEASRALYEREWTLQQLIAEEYFTAASLFLRHLDGERDRAIIESAFAQLDLCWRIGKGNDFHKLLAELTEKKNRAVPASLPRE